MSKLQKSWRILIKYESPKISARSKISLMVKNISEETVHTSVQCTFPKCGTAKAHKINIIYTVL
jgi:hypothetical protein